MNEFEYSITDTGRGMLQQFASGERRAMFLTAPALAEHPRIGQPITALRDALAAGSEQYAALAPDLSPSGKVKLARQIGAEKIAPAFRSVQAAMPGAVADNEARLASFSTPTFPDSQPPAVRVEQRQHARSLKLPHLIEAARVDPSLADAVIEGGLSMSGLPGDVFDRLRRDAAVGQAERILTEQRRYTTPATADDPVGGRPDPVAARADAEALISALEVESELLADVPRVLSSAVQLVAMLTEMPVDDAFQMLTAEAV